MVYICVSMKIKFKKITTTIRQGYTTETHTTFTVM